MQQTWTLSVILTLNTGDNRWISTDDDGNADGDKEEENGGEDENYCLLTALTPAWRSLDTPIWR